MSGVELYVYYRVAAADEALACAQVQALQQRLGAELPGLQARLLRRGAEGAEGASAGLSTWMETYRHADGLDAARLARIRQVAGGVPSACVGARHEECFEPIDPAGTDGTAPPGH